MFTGHHLTITLRAPLAVLCTYCQWVTSKAFKEREKEKKQLLTSHTNSQKAKEKRTRYCFLGVSSVVKSVSLYFSKLSPSLIKVMTLWMLEALDRRKEQRKELLSVPSKHSFVITCVKEGVHTSLISSQTLLLERHNVWRFSYFLVPFLMNLQTYCLSSSVLRRYKRSVYDIICFSSF